MLRCDPAGQRVRCGGGGALECGRPAPACASSSVARCESSPGASNGSLEVASEGCCGGDHQEADCHPPPDDDPRASSGGEAAEVFECAGHGGLLCRPAPGAQDQTPP
jgi:hypothetical protein